MKHRLTLLAGVAAALVLAPAAVAHVEISPDKVSADSSARFTIEVPAERNVPTVKFEVKLPPGLVDVRLAAKPGWASTIRSGIMIWFGGKIRPGHSGRFVFRARVPATPGKELIFPAIQTYAKGPVVRWISAPNSETPAPRVTLEKAAVTGTTKREKGFPVTLTIVLAILIVGGMVGLFALRRVILRSLD